MGTRGKVRSLDYLAGLFDGEGSISIIRHTRHDSRGGFQHQLRVTVGMIDRETVEHFQKRWGGTLYNSKEYLKHPGKWRQAFAWSVGSAAAAEFLKEIRPKLHIKEPQATLGIEFQSLLSTHFASRGVPKEVIDVRNHVWLAMRKLNGTLERFGGTARRD